MTIKISVYIVIRHDKFFDNIKQSISVVSVLPTVEEAESEVERLNKLNGDDHTEYCWSATRYYPEGRDLS